LDWSEDRDTSNSTKTTTTTPQSSSSPSDEVPTYFALKPPEPSSSSQETKTDQVNINFYLWAGLGMVIVMLVGGIILVYRKHELDRWQQYRTHQLLQAQEEAFDLSFVEEEDELDFELSPPPNRKT
jgi:hypothetical protein